MYAGNSPVRPYIGFSAGDQVSHKVIVREILAGVEEEGIPCLMLSQSSKNTVDLAYRCAQHSPLGVGISVGTSGDVAVHYKRLREEAPLFYLPAAEGNINIWRTMGSHAARLVKGIPFKDGLNKEGSSREDPISLEAKIREIIEKILHHRDT